MPIKDMNHEDKTLVFSHLWDWFSLHAQQRQQIFRFYLIIVAAIFVGLVQIASKEYYILGSLICILLSLFSFLFLRLDERSVKLIKVSEIALSKFENYYSEGYNIPELNLFILADKKKKDGFTSFREIYGKIFYVVIVFSIIAAIGFGLLFFLSLLANPTSMPAVPLPAS